MRRRRRTSKGKNEGAAELQHAPIGTKRTSACKPKLDASTSCTRNIRDVRRKEGRRGLNAGKCGSSHVGRADGFVNCRADGFAPRVNCLKIFLLRPLCCNARCFYIFIFFLLHILKSFFSVLQCQMFAQNAIISSVSVELLEFVLLF